MKQTIRLTESELNNLIVNSVRRIINEIKYQGVSFHGQNPSDFVAMSNIRDAFNEKELELANKRYSLLRKFADREGKTFDGWDLYKKQERHAKAALDDFNKFSDLSDQKGLTRQEQRDQIDKGHEKAEKVLNNFDFYRNRDK